MSKAKQLVLLLMEIGRQPAQDYVKCLDEIYKEAQELDIVEETIEMCENIGLELKQRA